MYVSISHATIFGMLTSNIVIRLPIRSVNTPEIRLPIGCPMKIVLANQDACPALILNDSSACKWLSTPVNGGITIAGKAKMHPRFHINRFFAELAKNWKNPDCLVLESSHDRRCLRTQSNLNFRTGPIDKLYVHCSTYLRKNTPKI